MMHKLSIIAGLLAGALIAVGAVGFVEGVLTGHEFIALLIFLFVGGIASVILDSRGQ